MQIVSSSVQMIHSILLKNNDPSNLNQQIRSEKNHLWYSKTRNSILIICNYHFTIFFYIEQNK